MKRLAIIAAMVVVLMVLSIALEKTQSNSKVSKRRLAATPTSGLSTPTPLATRKGEEKSTKAIEVADRFIQEHKKKFKLQSHHELRPIAYQTPLKTVIRYSIFQGNLPVVGIGIELELDRSLNIVRVRNEYRPLEAADTRIQPEAETLSKKISVRFELKEENLDRVAPILYALPHRKKPEMAYVLRVKDRFRQGRASHQVVFRASDGQVLGRNQARSEF